MGAGVLTEQLRFAGDIARRVGTPTYVYDAGTIRDRYRALRDALAGFGHRIHYSVKANSNLAVLGVLRDLGAGVDIVSGGELMRALRAGFCPEDVIFSGVGKRDDELEAAITNRVALVNVESFAELQRLDVLARRHDVAVEFGIRVNPDVRTTTHPYTQTGEGAMKFGVPMHEVLPMASWAADQEHVRLTSVGMHIGSQILDAEHYRAGAAKLAGVVADLSAVGTRLRSVDVGGGIGIGYLRNRPLEPAAFAAAVRPLADATGLPLVVEPGRYLVGDAGALLTQCLSVKSTVGRTFAIVDAAMNDFVRPALYGAEHDVIIAEPASEPVSDPGPLDVVGPVCESGDFLARNRTLSGVGPGALLAVLGAGAYGFVMSSTYNSRVRPAEVLVDGDRWAVVRCRDDADDLIRGETALEALGPEDWRS